MLLVHAGHPSKHLLMLHTACESVIATRLWTFALSADELIHGERERERAMLAS
jgi:hypothetical protein